MEEYCDRLVSELEQDLLFRNGNETLLEPAAVLNSLQQQELQQPGSVSVQLTRHKRSVILVGEDPAARINTKTSRAPMGDDALAKSGEAHHPRHPPGDTVPPTGKLGLRTHRARPLLVQFSRNVLPRANRRAERI